MSDLICINEIFRNLFTINEDKIPQTQKNTYHVYFKKNQIKLTAFFSNLEIKEAIVFHIKVKSTKLDFIQPFQLILSKLITKEYKTKFDTIVNSYKNYKSILPSFNQIFGFEDGRLITMKEKPDIFPPKYRSKVQKYPNIYSNDDETLRTIRENKSYSIMKFPTYPENLIDDSVRYVCDRSPGYNVPGLNVNTFENKEAYPYLPQCFQKEQLLKKNDPTFNQRFRYYSIEDKENIIVPEIEITAPTSTKEKQVKIKLSGFMNKNIFGFLPDKLNKIFLIADNDIDNFSWYRLGISDSYNINSFIIAVLTALNHNDLTSFTIDDIRTEILAELSVVAKQENFDKSITDIKDDIERNETYFNPRLYIHLLEQRYNCNIILFDKNNFILPRCINGYYRNSNDFNYIFIYEHNDDVHARCEIIGRNANVKKKLFQSVFESDDAICKKIVKLYQDMYDVHINIFPDKLIENNQSQIIDVSGKCRGFNFQFSDSLVTMFFSANIYQPLNIESGNIYEVEYNKIKNLVTEFNLLDILIEDSCLYSKIVIDGRVISIYFKIKGNEEINLSSFNLYNKLSRYITQYFIWLYSKFLHESTDLGSIYLDPYKNLDSILNTIDIDTNKNKFIERYIQIIPSFDYNTIPNKFSLEDCGIIYNSKLVIKSQLTLRKLFYVLKMYIQRHFITFLSFHQKKTIDNYYIDVIDFDQKPFQFICKGYNYTLQWIRDFFDNSLFSANFVFNTLRTDKTCFFYQNNSYFNGKNFTVYKSFSLNDAITISLNAKNVYISGEIDYLLSTFKNNVLISTYYVDHKKPNTHQIHIVFQDSMFFSFLT